MLLFVVPGKKKTFSSLYASLLISHCVYSCLIDFSVSFSAKDCNSCSALPSRIKRVFYMSSEGSNLLHEVGTHSIDLLGLGLVLDMQVYYEC